MVDALLTYGEGKVDALLTYGEGKVDAGVDDLLCNIVEIVPAIIGPQARVESCGNVSCE